MKTIYSGWLPSELFLEAENIAFQVGVGELSKQDAKRLLKSIDFELHQHNFWLPERLKVQEGE